MEPAQFFSKSEQHQIEDAIKHAETHTSGEIRVHIEKICSGDVLNQSAMVFKKLGMHKTAQRNAVLFYIAYVSQEFAIIGDAGINSVVPPDFWDKIKDHMSEHFHKNEFTKGIVDGVKMTGEALQKHFPCQKNDVNELNNEVSFG